MSNKILATITAVAGILSVLSLAAYYLALHDIFRDYTSASLIQNNIITPAALPGWTACAPEWKVVKVCFWPMAAFHAIFLAGLITHRRQPCSKADAIAER